MFFIHTCIVFLKKKAVMDNTLGLCEPMVWICLALQLSNDTHSAQVDSFLITCKHCVIITSFKIYIDSWYCLEVANNPKTCLLLDIRYKLNIFLQ